MASYSWGIAFGIFVVEAALLNGVLARQFMVGGPGGWALMRSGAMSHNEWAGGRYRFIVGDTLVFKYNPSEDSVARVSADDYKRCSISNPIAFFKDANTVFQLRTHGPFYFVSGSFPNCEKGERLFIVVHSHRKTSPRFTDSPAPAPAQGLVKGHFSLNKVGCCHDNCCAGKDPLCC